MKNALGKTTKAKSESHDTLLPLLQSMSEEFKELSKKKPDSAVSKSKITIVNRLLEAIRLILKDEASITYLDLLDEDSVPQVSDVSLILSQYVAAMQAFRSRYYGYIDGDHQWSLVSK